MIPKSGKPLSEKIVGGKPSLESTLLEMLPSVWGSSE
jgi:hypothetical protein